ncbi:MAG: hypothetical protein E7671_01380 [Ruminococcaceae bacterium]|nr:hypothetical protein [Oscillospiraceae bacterium]
MYTYIDPDLTGDVLDDTCYERNLTVEEEFNIEISEEFQSYNDIARFAKNLILTDEDVYDAMYIPTNSLTPIISENLFYDLMEIEELHMDQIWWDQPLIKRNIIEDRLFYATSDLHLMAFEGVWCMYFNEDMMKELNLELPYQMALDGKWTFDQLKQYCSVAANLNGDATWAFDVYGNARYGMVDFGNAVRTAYSMGGEYTSMGEDGKYQFTADTDQRFLSVWESLINFYGPQNGLQLTASAQDLDPDGYYSVFMADRAMFLHAELKGATMLREWEGNFGLLPEPKFDETQENYESGVFTGCLAFCIPSTNVNLERTGTIVDYLTYESYKGLLPRYYDIHVSLKALGKQESIDVLELVRGTRGQEAAVFYGWTTDLQTAISDLVTKNELSLASTIQTYKDAVISNINTTYASYPSLRHTGE